MRRSISSDRISELWQSEHPRTKQPPIKAYVTTKQDLNRITSSSLKGRGNLEQNTRGEYGRRNAVSPETHNVRGLVVHGNKTNVILVERGTKRSTTHILKHELNHIFEQRK